MGYHESEIRGLQLKKFSKIAQMKRIDFIKAKLIEKNQLEI
ncbi:19197_t:CDS:2 [Funneliformis geosporum]|nr:19197_t:CDS:2 [Funneliformis geosporum]